MPSLMELIERVNKGESIDPSQLEIYQESNNSAEKFLAHHAQSMLDLRRAQQHMLLSLEAIDYSDQKVLSQLMSVSGFLGLTDMRAAPVAKFAACAIGRREFALGLEALQNGVSYDLRQGGAWTADRENCQFVAAQYERVAQGVGWTSEESPDWNNAQARVGVIVSTVADEDASGRMIRALAKYHDSRRFKLKFYSTEVGVRRDKQQFAQNSYVSPSSKRGAKTIAELSKPKMTIWTAPTEGDLVLAARESAAQMVRDKIDVAVIDASQADPIAALVAVWDTAAVKINLVRRAPLYSNGVDCVVYLDPARFEADRSYWQKRDIDSKFILEGIDTDAPLGPVPRRTQYGIPEASVVLATASQNLDKTMSEEFVETIIAILRAHPNAIWLAIGEGEMVWQKRKFESAGVAKRVGYAGRRRDLPGFLRIADLYLAEFPAASPYGVLQAMSIECPIVVKWCGEEGEQSQAATLVGSEAAITGKDCGGFMERVTRIIKEPAYRAKLGKMMRTRLDQHFNYFETARLLAQLFEQLIQQKQNRTNAPSPQGYLDAPGDADNPEREPQPIAQVA